MESVSRIRSRQVAAVAGVVADARKQDDIPLALDLMVSRLREVLSADGVTVELEQKGSLVCCYASGLARRWLSREVPVAGSLAGLCYAASEPLMSADVRRDRRIAGRNAPEPQVRSMVSVPLRLHGATVGVLRAFAGRSDVFSGRDLDICRLAAAAIQRMLMHELRRAQPALGNPDHLVTTGLWALRDRRKSQVLRAGDPSYTVSVVRLDIRGYLTSEILGHVSYLVRSTDQCLREDAGAYSVVMPGTTVEEATTAARRLKSELESFAHAAGDEVVVEFEVQSLIAPQLHQRSA